MKNVRGRSYIKETEWTFRRRSSKKIPKRTRRGGKKLKVELYRVKKLRFKKNADESIRSTVSRSTGA